ncbi:uncharacterized protein LOC128389185 isoform X1 [Panonychus citri]|uniref:uncharacterized protein LOC128389185 isoform X1 n=1 Tax=Panonychus citri TaxID=50023 RepID=UPI0023079410|nr:uncharacterized protein LOC128389185 isoform X1 [Panonychus citri]
MVNTHRIHQSAKQFKINSLKSQKTIQLNMNGFFPPKINLNYLNARKMKEITTNLITKTLNSKSSILVLVEVNRAIAIKFTGRNLILNDQTAIITSPDIQIHQCDTSVKNCTAIIISQQKRQLLIIGSYIAHSDQLKNVVDFVDLISSFVHLPIVITMDSNCEHPLWSTRTNYPRFSTLLANFFIKSNLIVLNKPRGDNFSYQHNNKRSWIDIVASNIRDITLVEGEIITDHREYKLTIPMQPPFIEISNTKETKYMSKYKLDFVADNPHEFFTRLVSFQTEHCKTKVFQKVTTNRRISRLRTKIQRMKRAKLPREMIKPLETECIRLRIGKKIGTQRYMFRYRKDSTKVWQFINKLLNLNSNRIVISQQIQPDTSSFSKTYTHNKVEIGSPSILSEKEIDLITSMNFRKTSGNADEFSLKIWKKFWKVNKEMITSAVKTSFEEGVISPAIKVFGAHFIPKPGGSLRLIKISNFILKIFDIILTKRIQSTLNKILVPNSQFAYQASVNNIDLHIILRQHLDNGIAISIDATKAFDFISMETIYSELENHVDPGTLSMIKSFHTNRCLRYKSSNETLYRNDDMGTAAGSSLGPILFIVGLNSAIRKLTDLNIRILAFADDIIILVMKLIIVNILELPQKNSQRLIFKLITVKLNS